MLYARLISDSTAVETVIELSPDYAASLPASKRALLRVLVVDPQPTPTATQILSTGGYIIEPDRVRQAWTLRGKTPDELRINVSPRQIRQALNAAGMRASVEAGVAAADQDTKDWWEFATSFESDHPMVVAMCSALGITDEQRAQVFQLAATL